MLTVEMRDPDSPYFGACPKDYPFKIECDNERCAYSFVSRDATDNLKYDLNHVCDAPRKESDMSFMKYCRVENAPTGGGTSALSMMWRLIDEDMLIIMDAESHTPEAIQSAKDRARGAAALMSVSGNKAYRTPAEVSIHAMRRYRMIQAGELEVGAVHNYGFDISDGDDISPDLRRVIGWPDGHKLSGAFAPWVPHAGPWREQWLRLEAARAQAEGVNTPTPESVALSKSTESVQLGASEPAAAPAPAPVAQPLVSTAESVMKKVGITQETYDLIRARAGAGFTPEMLAMATGISEAEVQAVINVA